MELRPYKFVVAAVMQQIVGGSVVGETTAEQTAVYGVDGLARYAAGFEAAVAEQNVRLEQVHAASEE